MSFYSDFTLINFTFWWYWNHPCPFSQSNKNVGQINATSLNVEDKFDEITTLVFEQQLDTFSVSETWLDQGVTSDSFRLSGFIPMYRWTEVIIGGSEVLRFIFHQPSYLWDELILSIAILNYYVLKFQSIP